MKTYSMRYKFLRRLIFVVLAAIVLIGGVSFYEIDHFIWRQTESFVNTTCEKETVQVNGVFADMEKSVNIMKSYVLDYFSGVTDVEDRDWQNEVIEYAEKMFWDVAKYTSGAVAYYVRFAPEISDSTAGFFYSKSGDSDRFIRFDATDLSIYARNDTEHVGWYWQPYEAGRAVWMKPYHNQNNGITMISYVVPLYYEGQFVGVVGMDFDYTVLTDKVHGIKLYENGFAHLEQDGATICHDGELAYAAEDYMQASGELVNGMTLVLSASRDDIRLERNKIARQMLHIILSMTAIFAAMSMFMAEKIVRPLKNLTEASKKLAARNYNVEFERSDITEIQLLSTAFEDMAKQLREHEKLQYQLAYRDSLTGLRNTTSYKSWVTDFNKEIQSQEMDFGVMVFDINYLKETNDQYGHETGNKLIVSAARLIAGTFKRSPVFRIGGDEFLAILRGSDLEDCENLCAKFDSECAHAYIEADQTRLPVRIARGFSKYDSGTDAQFADVFNRADEEMYKNKKEIKSRQNPDCFFKQ